jgi:hypothetical protein
LARGGATNDAAGIANYGLLPGRQRCWSTLR